MGDINQTQEDKYDMYSLRDGHQLLCLPQECYNVYSHNDWLQNKQVGLINESYQEEKIEQIVMIGHGREANEKGSGRGP